MDDSDGVVCLTPGWQQRFLEWYASNFVKSRKSSEYEITLSKLPKPFAKPKPLDLNYGRSEN